AAGQQPPLLHRPRIGKPRGRPLQIASWRMAGGALPVEICSAGGWISRHDGFGPDSGRIAAVDGEAVEKRGDVRDLSRGDFDLRHDRGAPALKDARDGLAVVIVLHELRAEQAGAIVTATGVLSVAERTIDAVDGLSALNHRRIGAALRIGWATTPAATFGRRLLRGRQRGSRDRGDDHAGAKTSDVTHFSNTSGV